VIAMAIPASRRKPDSRWPCGVPRKWCPDHPPEKICQEYPSVGLADVYAVIAFYLGRRDEIDAYPDTVREREANVVEEIELRSPLPEIQRRLLARKTQPA
jgi:hypothetical protein